MAVTTTSKILKGSNKRLDIIISKIIKYRDSMREAFAEYCKAAIEEGFTANEAWQYISKRLVDVVPRTTLYRWAEKELPLEAKKSTKPRSMSKKIPTRESSESERSQSEYRKQGRINQDPDEYEIDKVDEYDAEYLRDVVKWQYKTKNELIEEAFKWQIKFDEMKARMGPDYMKSYKEQKYDTDSLLRHFKLCTNCFYETKLVDQNNIGRKLKYVKGVYDYCVSGTATQDGNSEYFILGWVCKKHRARDEALTKELGSVFKIRS